MSLSATDKVIEGRKVFKPAAREVDKAVQAKRVVQGRRGDLDIADRVFEIRLAGSAAKKEA